MNARIVAVAAIAASMVASRCSADLLDFQGNDGVGGTRSADANFSLSGSQLTLTLSNPSTKDVTNPNQVLTGVFFNILTNPNSLQSALNPQSAVGEPVRRSSPVQPQ